MILTATNPDGNYPFDVEGSYGKLDGDAFRIVWDRRIVAAVEDWGKGRDDVVDGDPHDVQHPRHGQHLPSVLDGELNGESCLHFHFAVWGRRDGFDFEYGEYCAVVEPRIEGRVVLGDYATPGDVGHDRNRGIGSAVKVCDMQKLMLVAVGQFPQQPQTVAGHVVGADLVRLNRFDECPVVWLHTLEAGRRQYKKGPLSWLVVDGEGIPATSGDRPLAIEQDELPDQVIERRAQVVKNVANKNAEAGGGLNEVGSSRYHAWMVFGDGDVDWIGFDPLPGFTANLFDVLRCPIELLPTSDEAWDFRVIAVLIVVQAAVIVWLLLSRRP